MRLAIDPFRLRLISLAGWLNQRQKDGIDYLQEENRVLREQLGGKRLRLTTISACAWPSGPRNLAGVCLDSVIILGARHLRAILKSYLDYYHRSRTHLALGKDAPEPRMVQPPELGGVVELPEVGGLHHRYERRAA